MPAPDRKRRLTAFTVAMAILIAAPLAVVASDAFEDVPDSNVHHDDITWLADNNVTAGCNPPDNTEFCPGDPVLRQQMASFMRRLAENEVVNAATANEADHATTADSADDADTVDGEHAADLRTTINGVTRAITTGTGSPIPVAVGEQVLLAQTTLNAEEGTVALVVSSALAEHVGVVGTSGRLVTWVQESGICNAATWLPGSAASVQLEDGFGTVSTSTVVEVSGSVTLRLCATALPQPFEVEEVTLNAVQGDSGALSVAAAGGEGANPSGLLDE